MCKNNKEQPNGECYEHGSCMENGVLCEYYGEGTFRKNEMCHRCSYIDCQYTEGTYEANYQI